MDNKNSCLGVYSDNRIYPSHMAIDLSKTWHYHPVLKNYTNIEYGKIYANGLTLTQVCPEYLKDDWNNILEKNNKFIKTFITSKVDLIENCYYDLIPEYFIHQYFSISEEIIKNVFNTYNKPKNHDFLVELWKFTNDLNNNKIKHNIPNTVQNYKAFNKNNIDYNIFGTITGRLSTAKNSFPILHFPKQLRKYIKPHKDLFLKIDFNGAEFRTVLDLANLEQPSNDVIEEYSKILNIDSREKTKKKIYSWLYNPNAKFKELENIINKEEILNRFYKNNKVINTFNREIECDNYHAFNYLIQSEFSDTFQEKAIEVHKNMSKLNSFIAWVVHDELVIDLAKNEIDAVIELLHTFVSTRHGKFRAKASVGLNYGEMKEWKIF